MISIYGRRVRASDGAVLDSQAFLLAIAPTQLVDKVNEFAVAANGDTFLVAYSDGDTIRGVRVRASDGAVLAPAGFPISTAKNSLPIEPAIASDGTSFLVAWTDSRNPSITPTGANPDVYGSLVSKDGTVANTSGTAIDTGLDHAMRPAIAWNGSEYLVAFRHWGLQSQTYDVSAHRVSATGSAQGSSFALVAANADGLDLSFGGGRFALAYRTSELVRAQWFDSSGAAVGTGIDLGTSDRIGPPPSIAWDGLGFFATWVSRVSDTQVQLQGVRLTTTGTALDTTPTALGPNLHDDDNELTTDVERLGTSRWLLAYPRFDATVGTYNVRAFARVVTAAIPAPATDGGTGGTGGGGGGGGTVGGIACNASSARSFDLTELLLGLALVATIVTAARRARR